MASSLAFVSRTETLSCYSYKTLSQARYAAESGLHSAANHLLWTYQPPDTPGAAIPDPLASYDMAGAWALEGYAMFSVLELNIDCIDRSMMSAIGATIISVM